MKIITIFIFLLMISAIGTYAQTAQPSKLFLAGYNQNIYNYDIDNNQVTNALDFVTNNFVEPLYFAYPNFANDINCHQLCREYQTYPEVYKQVCLSVGLDWISNDGFVNDTQYWSYENNACIIQTGAECDTNMANLNSGQVCGPHILQQHQPMWTNCQCAFYFQ